MKIAILSELNNTIKKDATAGTQIWTYDFAEELIRRGHHVTLFANSESKISDKIVKICSPKEINIGSEDEIKSRNKFFIAKAVLEMIKRQNEFDLIHVSLFGMHYVLVFSDFIQKPIFVTMHGLAVSENFTKMIFKTFPKAHYIFISEFFSKRLKPYNYPVIHNGIKVDSFPFSNKSKNYYFWFNRMNKEKGAENAIEFAQKTKTELLLAGPVTDKKYFDSMVKPNLSSKIKYLGPLDFNHKIKYYKEAKALLVTINWEEPFGLTLIESMACGTPVIAFCKGAIPEIIQDGFNGYLVDPAEGVSGLIKAFQKLANLSSKEYVQMRQNCRKHVEKYFTLEKMVDEYEATYKKILQKTK